MSNLIKDLPQTEKPRERFLEYGAKKMSDEELIAILLRTGTKSQSAKTLATSIICEAKGIKNLSEIGINRLSKIKGIGTTKAITLLAAIELGNRIYAIKPKYHSKINSADVVYQLFHEELKNSKQEQLIVLILDNKNKLLSAKTVFIGTINSSIVHPREIFKSAISESASGLILVHNHPSGDSTPSLKDDMFTIEMQKASTFLEIPLIDHIIIGHNNYYSYKEKKWDAS